MRQINVHEAKTHLSKFIDQVAAGEEIVIARSGKPMVKLVPFEEDDHIVFGVMEGQFKVPDNFDDPLPKEIEASFYGA